MATTLYYFTILLNPHVFCILFLFECLPNHIVARGLKYNFSVFYHYTLLGHMIPHLTLSMSFILYVRMCTCNLFSKNNYTQYYYQCYKTAGHGIARA